MSLTELELQYMSSRDGGGYLTAQHNGENYAIQSFGSAFLLLQAGSVLDWDNDLPSLINRFPDNTEQ